NWRLDMIAQERAALVTERESMHKEQRDLFDQRKSPGPNLKEIRAKLRPEWIAGWIKNPRLFRPGTKMPVFRLDDEQVKAIAAFIWQRALDPEKLGLPFERHQPRGDPTKGRELFKSRGCMGCHSLDGRGGDFAADLSRVGEKINYDYLVRWIHDPGQRLAPYSPDAGRDLLPADFEKAGRSFTWSSEDAECPVSGGELVTHNMTVMPSLRLTWDEARDIGSYLMTRNTDASYPPAEFLEDKTLAARGEHLVKHFGCAACHEIAGLENEGGIGTELTKWGSKPIDRIDFGLLTHDIKAEGKYDHKHFAMAKLKRPEIWDDGKEKRPLDKLRMPNFGLSDEERNALTTFLIGSVDSRYPERFYYNPQGLPSVPARRPAQDPGSAAVQRGERGLRSAEPGGRGLPCQARLAGRVLARPLPVG
ncbi:MAG: c-type cytochrome, partial [Planctomycetota bacterium]